MKGKAGRPEWQDWPEEPWSEVFIIVARGAEGGGQTADPAAGARARACVNALAGIRNPAAVGRVIDEAKMVVEIYARSIERENEERTGKPGIAMLGLREALAALNQEPESS